MGQAANTPSNRPNRSAPARKHAPASSLNSPPTKSPSWRAGLTAVILLTGVALLAALLAGRVLFPSEDTAHAPAVLFVLATLATGALFVLLRLLTPAELTFSEEAPPGTCRRPWLNWVVSSLGNPSFYLLVLVGWVWLSAWQAANRFPAINLAWEWTGLLGMWLFIRQADFFSGWGKDDRQPPTDKLIPASAKPGMPHLGQAQLPEVGSGTSLSLPAPLLTALGVVLLAVTLGQSGTAVWQLAVEYPELRAYLASGAGDVREQLATMGIEPGSPAEQRLHDRAAANEAMGTFGHPNSLGGFLVLALPLVVAFTVQSWQAPGILTGLGSLWVRLFTVATLLAALLALLLTRSRSAWLAVLACGGLAVIARGLRGVARRWNRRYTVLLLGVLIAGGGVVAGLVRVGVFDRLVLTESLKSLRYRWEWWQASAGMIADHPWLGVGPGNFASRYLQYKLPFSSEEISDPHNFIVEWASSAGLLAPFLYLAALMLALRETLRGGWANQQESEVAAASLARETALLVSGSVTSRRERGLSPPSWESFLVEAAMLGAVGGAALTLRLPAPLWTGIVAFGLAWLAVFPLAPRLARQALPHSDTLRFAVVVGVVGLHIHWLAAGSMFFPSLTFPCWLLLGSATCARRFPVR